jgi:hypothetical protein
MEIKWGLVPDGGDADPGESSVTIFLRELTYTGSDLLGAGSAELRPCDAHLVTTRAPRCEVARDIADKPRRSAPPSACC